ncbi:MAG: cytochrome b [Betaproteobacteria bacterium]|nr:cytochrome b [Betaproteobacteria bacterium]
MSTAPTRYTGTAKVLHWLIALMILTAFGVGFYMTGLKFSPEKLKLYNWHKWAGVTIFMLVVLRVLWRLTHKPPPLPDTMPTIQKFAAHFGHGLLYFFMIAIPLSGWLMSSAKGFQTVWFGVLPLPDLLEKSEDLGKTLELVHRWLNYTMIATVAGHAAAALKHHLIDRDDILRRMLPGKNA